MTRFLRAALLLAAAALLAGCTGWSPTPYWKLKEADFSALQPGVTTKAEVRKRLGNPFTEVKFARLNEEVWDYNYLDITIVMLAYVHFDANGVYQRTDETIDPAFYDGIDNR